MKYSSSLPTPLVDSIDDKKLMNCQYKPGESVEKFVKRFRVLAAESGIEETTIKDIQYFRSLILHCHSKWRRMHLIVV
jgi:hypothetical protein